MRACFGILIGLCVGSAAQAGPAVELSAGVSREAGDYGTGTEIERITSDAAVRARFGRVTLAASVPWERVSAPGNVIAGGGLLGLPILVDPSRPAARQVRSGLGDVRLGASYALPRLAGFDLALNAEAKLPTASRRDGLGTGAADVAVGADLARTFGAVTPFASVSYTVPGDAPGLPLDPGLAARSGIAVRLGSAVRGSLAYGYAQSASPQVADAQQLSTGLDIGLSQRLSLGVQGSAGLSSGAADTSVGVRLGWRLF